MSFGFLQTLVPPMNKLRAILWLTCSMLGLALTVVPQAVMAEPPVVEEEDEIDNAGGMTAGTIELRVYRLQHAKADQIERVIQKLFQGQLTAISTNGDDLIVRADPNTQREIETLLLKLDAKPLAKSPVGMGVINGPLETSVGSMEVRIPAFGFTYRGPEEFPPPQIGFVRNAGIKELEASSLQLAVSIRQRGELEPNLEARQQELKILLTQLFQLRQQEQKDRVAEARKRLDALAATLAERDQQANQIIDRRLADLLNPNLNWDPPEVAQSKAGPGSTDNPLLNGMSKATPSTPIHWPGPYGAAPPAETFPPVTRGRIHDRTSTPERVEFKDGVLVFVKDRDPASLEVKLIAELMKAEGLPVQIVNIDRQPQLVKQFQVTSVPTAVRLVDGKSVTYLLNDDIDESRLKQLIKASSFNTTPANTAGHIQLQTVPQPEREPDNALKLDPELIGAWKRIGPSDDPRFPNQQWVSNGLDVFLFTNGQLYAIDRNVVDARLKKLTKDGQSGTPYSVVDQTLTLKVGFGTTSKNGLIKHQFESKTIPKELQRQIDFANFTPEQFEKLKASFRPDDRLKGVWRSISQSENASRMVYDGISFFWLRDGKPKSFNNAVDEANQTMQGYSPSRGVRVVSPYQIEGDKLTIDNWGRFPGQTVVFVNESAEISPELQQDIDATRRTGEAGLELPPQQKPMGQILHSDNSLALQVDVPSLPAASKAEAKRKPAEAPRTPGEYDIVLLNKQGEPTNRISLKQVVAGDHALAFHPQGRQLAYDALNVNGLERKSAMQILNLGDHSVIDVGAGSGLSWSPDGTRFCFSDEWRTGHPRGICLMDADGTDREMIAEGRGARWSPDGKTIAYPEDDNWVLYDLATKNPRYLWSWSKPRPYASLLGFPTWSPDSQQLAFIGKRHDGELDLGIVKVTGQPNLVVLDSGTLATGMAWHPEGNRLVYRKKNSETSLWQLLEVDPSAEPTANQPRKIQAVPGPATDEQIMSCAFSPDGQTLAYISVLPERLSPARLTESAKQGATKPKSAAKRRVMILSADGETLEEIWSDPHWTSIGSPSVDAAKERVALDGWKAGQNTGDAVILIIDLNTKQASEIGPGAMPTWSPDGKQLAFSSYGKGGEARGVYIMQADGTGRTQIGNGWSAQWSPDGKTIASTQGGSFELYDVATKEKRTIPTPYQFIYWNPCWSGDSKRLCFAGVREDGKQDLATINVESGEVKVHDTDKSVQGDFAWNPVTNRIVFGRQREAFDLEPDVDDFPRPLRGVEPGVDFVSTGGTWTADGQHLIYIAGPALTDAEPKAPAANDQRLNDLRPAVPALPVVEAPLQEVQFLAATAYSEPVQIAQAPKEKKAPPKHELLSTVDDTAESRKSIAGSGHAVKFKRGDLPQYVEGIDIFATRYGYPQAPKEDFKVWLLDKDQNVIKELEFPYSKVPRTPDLAWRKLTVPLVEVPEEFFVAVAFNPEQTKGIYLGIDENAAEPHSYVGIATDGLEEWTGKGEWMIRVQLTDREPPK